MHLGKEADFQESIKWEVEQNYLALKTIENCVCGRVHIFAIERIIDKNDDKELLKEDNLNINDDEKSGRKLIKSSIIFINNLFWISFFRNQMWSGLP